VSQSAFFLWGGLIAAVMLAMAVLALLVAREHRIEPRPAKADCRTLLAEAKEFDELASAAFRKALEANDAAARAAADLAEAEANRDLASQEQDAAAKALEVAIRTLATTPEPVRAAVDGPDSREASRAAMAAYRRGAISVDQLQVLWHQIDGWDQHRENQAHELTRLRAEDAEARRGFDAAALAERTARQAAEVARIAAQALTQEAADAARESQIAHLSAQRCIRRARRP
jgi:hypothetical protein